jgi:hypothetical protein
MRRATFLVALLVAVVLPGCTEGPMAPNPGGPSASLLSSSNAVSVVKRTVALTSDEVVSKNIGPLGGTIILPRSGLTVVVPLGALTTTTKITVTSPKGDLLGYEFEPHGLQFKLPVLLQQNILATKLSLATVLGGAFGAYHTDALAPTVNALEIINLQKLLGVVVLPVKHFSGYVIATNAQADAFDDE